MADQLAKAALLLSDMFSAAVLAALQEQPPRRFLYGWETETLQWLKEWRASGGEGPLNYWTASYMRYNGPPPWPRELRRPPGQAIFDTSIPLDAALSPATESVEAE